MWKNIRKGVESFFGHVLYVAGEGLHIRFWYDLWCGHIPLKDLCPDLFSRATGKEASISELITISSDGGSRSWNIQFHRAPDDWEKEIVFAFYEHVYSKLPRGEGIDSLFWKLTLNDVFDVLSFYNSLSTPTFPFPWKYIWSIKVPRRVSFFLWTATRDSIFTIDNLVKRNLSLVNWCYLCRCDEKTVDHLLIHCKFAHALWRSVFDVWFVVGDAKDGCFSSFCIGEFFGVTLFFGLEYGANLFDMVDLEGTYYLYF